jgi:hypothetical protein
MNNLKLEACRDQVEPSSRLGSCDIREPQTIMVQMSLFDKVISQQVFRKPALHDYRNSDNEHIYLQGTDRKSSAKP